MATASQITQVRLNIDDINSEDFDDAIISSYIDLKSSVNWASWQLIEILIVRLRNDLLKSDTTGVEQTTFASLTERLKILQIAAAKYKDDYESELGLSTGIYISTVKPTIAGGDI